MTGPTAAVLADIHGNYPALEACLDYARARGAEHCLFLGDYITDHPGPQRVMALLRQAESRFDCTFIRGNREDYMTAYRANPTGWRNSSAQGALLDCYEQLSAADIDWFASLPIYREWQLPGAPPVGLCHGSPRATRAPMRGEPGSLELLAKTGPDLLVKGHNHKHWALTHQGKQLVCAGSVGVAVCRAARPGRPYATELAKRAQMALLHLRGGRWEVEYVRVPYDWEGALRNLGESRLPERAPVWAALLRFHVLTGLDPFFKVPSYAQGLYRAEAGVEAPWPEVPEVYWRRAAKAFGVELYR